MLAEQRQLFSCLGSIVWILRIGSFCSEQLSARSWHMCLGYVGLWGRGRVTEAFRKQVDLDLVADSGKVRVQPFGFK
jgi:hypothetical protein